MSAKPPAWEVLIEDADGQRRIVSLVCSRHSLHGTVYENYPGCRIIRFYPAG